MKHLVFASDSFKGTLSSADTAHLLTQAALTVLGDCTCRAVPMADGGEGTVDAVVNALGATKVTARVLDPLGAPVNATYCIAPGGVAVIEMAAASGLTLVPPNLRNPLQTTTYGTGQLILDAINNGCRDVYIAIGGSATNDGGMGCMSALGVRFLNSANQTLAGRGIDLNEVRSISLDNMHHKIAETRFTVMCDVNNPLCGPTGATRIFAAQKGATPSQINELEQGMQNYANVLSRTFGFDVVNVPGAGAAGGLGAALMAILGANRKPGTQTVLQLTHFDEIIADADVVITGEGLLDAQSCMGKVPCGVGECCMSHNIPTITLVGGKGQGWQQILQHGVKQVFALTDYFPLQQCLDNPKQTYLAAATAMMQSIKDTI
ncbi:MAG: glycerate kinase [Muribaculaceae bacterium]